MPLTIKTCSKYEILFVFGGAVAVMDTYRQYRKNFDCSIFYKIFGDVTAIKIVKRSFLLIISFMCLATNCVTNIEQSKRENKK
jgi:hypothetical protein